MDLIRMRMNRRTFAGVAAGTGVALVASSPAIFQTVAAQDATPIPYEAPSNIGDLTGSFEADGSSTLGPLACAADTCGAKLCISRATPSCGSTRDRNEGVSAE